MDVMGFTKQEQHNLFRVIAAILHLGNISVTQDRSDQAQLKDTSIAEKVCHVLGIPLSEFVKGLLKPKVKAGREWVVQARTDQQVLYSIEALSTALYERMFDSIIGRINQAIDTPGKKFTTFIGVLDIAGFEIFEVNPLGCLIFFLLAVPMLLRPFLVCLTLKIKSSLLTTRCKKTKHK